MLSTKIHTDFRQYMLEANDHSFEALLLTPQKFTKALVVLIHGYNRFGAWEMFWPARRMLLEGFAVILPSQLGFGESRGYRDYCGPSTVDGIHTLIQKIAQENGQLNKLKIALWGISRGATVASLMVGKYPTTYTSSILQAGIYDMKADYEWKNKDIGIKNNIEMETGATDEAFAKRSAINLVEQIQTPLLIMHGGKDDVISANQARAFVSALQSEHELIILEEKGHKISGPNEINKYVIPFLQKHLI